MTINSPAQGTSLSPGLSPGPVLVTFNIQNSPVAPSATQPRMHFYVDNDPVPYKFYDGPGITEDGSTSGVRYQDLHTHFVHWKSGGSIQLNALASGFHQVRFVLVDQTEAPIPFTPPAVTNLVTAYGMNEGSGTTLADASGSGHTGTLVNGPAWVAGQPTYGQALSFDGLDDAVSVANPGPITSARPISRWKPGSNAPYWAAPSGISSARVPPPRWALGCKELYFNASNQLTFGSFSTGDTISSTIADTNWHHIAVTFTNSTKTLQIYVDGALATTATKALEADGAGHVVTVGNLFGTNTFSGAARRIPHLQPRADAGRDSGRADEYGEDSGLYHPAGGRRRLFPSRSCERLEFPDRDGDGSGRTDLCDRTGHREYPGGHANSHASMAVADRTVCHTPRGDWE